MKIKFTTILSSLVLASALLISIPARADECDKLTTEMCKVFDRMSTEVKSVKDLNGFMNIDFDKAIEGINADNIPEYCLERTLTASEKLRIKSAIDGFFDTFENKTYELTGGAVSRRDVSESFAPIRKQVAETLAKSKTFNDFAVNFQNLGM
ncbi:MAG: hypothetical protein J1E97_04825 [Muribaculaceae bacterium]|nr:hypothetical protein [Muribaculaceae bacterium]